MLRIHSFLQELYGYLKITLTKQIYRTCAVLLSGTAILTVVSLSSQSFGGGGKSRAIVYQSEEASSEESEDEEIDAETKAKIQTAESFADEEAQQIFVQDDMEIAISEEEENQLSAVTQTQEEVVQNEEIIILSGQEEDVLCTDSGAIAKYNAFMDSVVLTEEEKNSLLHLVAAEAGGCDLVGQILVANVVLNRMESKTFPDTVVGVIFQKNQFSPVLNGAIWSSTITDSVREAVERALDGEDFSSGATFFSARAYLDSSSMSWFDNNLNWLFAHDGHEFYSLKE